MSFGIEGNIGSDNGKYPISNKHQWNYNQIKFFARKCIWKKIRLMHGGHLLRHQCVNMYSYRTFKAINQPIQALPLASMLILRAHIIRAIQASVLAWRLYAGMLGMVLHGELYNVAFQASLAILNYGQAHLDIETMPDTNAVKYLLFNPCVSAVLWIQLVWS